MLRKSSAVQHKLKRSLTQQKKDLSKQLKHSRTADKRVKQKRRRT